MAYLQGYPQYVEFRNRTKTTMVDNPPKEPGKKVVPPEAPEELLQRGVDENRAAIESEILDKALAVDPSSI